MLRRRGRPSLGLRIPPRHCYERLDRLCCSGLHLAPRFQRALVACGLLAPAVPGLYAPSAKKSCASSVGFRSASMRVGLSYGFAPSKRDGLHLSGGCDLICSRKKCNDCMCGWMQ